MKTLARLMLLATSLVLMGLLPVPRTTPTPAARCAASKIFASGKAVRIRLACVAKATVTGTDEDAGCHGRAAARLLAAYARAEAKGGCLTADDGPAAAAVVEACVVRLREALRPRLEASACAGGKLRATGATILGKLRCERTGALVGAPPRPACLARRDARLAAKFAKLDPGTSCLTVDDVLPTRATLDQCVLDVVGPVPATTTTSLVPVPSTTTTVAGSTTSTTTSTSSSSSSTSSSSSSSTSSSSSSTSTSTSSTSTSSTSTSSSEPSTSSTSTSSTSTSTSSTTSTTETPCGGALCTGFCPDGKICTGVLFLCSCQ